MIALSSQINQPTDITRQDSRYHDLSAGGTYRRNIDNDTAMILGTSLGHRNYHDLNNKDTHTLGVFTTLERRFTPKLLTFVTANWTHSRVDSDSFQNVIGISPALRYSINDTMVLDLYYTASKINLPAATANPANLDRDSKLQTLGGTFTFSFPNMRSDLTLGARLLNNSAVGSDFDYTARQISGGIRTALPYDVVGTIGLVATRYDYDNLDSIGSNDLKAATGNYTFGIASTGT